MILWHFKGDDILQIPDTAFTHGGKFHADEVFSAALLKICNPNKRAERCCQKTAYNIFAEILFAYFA